LDYEHQFQLGFKEGMATSTGQQLLCKPSGKPSVNHLEILSLGLEVLVIVD